LVFLGNKIVFRAWVGGARKTINFFLTRPKGEKIARAKNSCHDLSIMAKTVGSNFFLKDRRLSASFKKGGFDALSAEAPYVPQGKGAESATSQRFSNSYWLAVYRKCRTSFD